MKKIILIAMVLGLAYVGIQALTGGGEPSEPVPPKKVASEAEPASTAVEPNLPSAPSTSQAAKDPNAPLSPEDEIRKLTDEEKWYEAFDKVQEYLKKNPNDTWALELGGMLLLSKMDKAEEALPYFQKYLELDPSSQFVIDRIMEIGDRTEQMDRSFKILQAIDQKSPGHPGLEMVLADGFLAHGNHEKAREYYQKSAQGDEQRSSAFRRLGRLEFDAGNYKKAQEDYRASMAKVEQEREVAAKNGENTKYLDQNLNYIRLDLIEALIKAKDFETARKELDAAAEFFPPDHPPLKKLQDELRDS